MNFSLISLIISIIIIIILIILANFKQFFLETSTNMHAISKISLEIG